MQRDISDALEHIVRLALEALRADAPSADVARLLRTALDDIDRYEHLTALARICADPLPDPDDLATALESALSYLLDGTASSPGASFGGTATASIEIEPDHGRYEMRRQIGLGGMGEVLEAFDRALRRIVAYKALRPGVDDPRSSHRFIQEARLTGRLQHPNVVPVYDVGADADGSPYYTMRRVEGETLYTMVREQRLGSLVNRLDIFRKVCDAVAYAHAQGVIHRDIKPSNIMVGTYGEVFLLDWGIARILDQAEDDGPPAAGGPATIGGPVSGTPAPGPLLASGEWTRAGDVMGSLAYMPPEQAAGRSAEVDRRADIYSLGAVLYSMLTGTAPFSPGSNTLEDVMQGRFVPPRDREPHLVSRDLDAVVRMAMATEPDGRYSTVEQLHRDVQAVLEGSAVGARRWSVTERLGKWIARHRRSAGLLGLIVVLSSASATITGALYVNRLQETTARAQLAERDAAIRLADGMVAQAEVLASSGKVPEARSLLWQARALYERNGQSDLQAEIIQSWIEQQHPSPLLAWEHPDGLGVGITAADPEGTWLLTSDSSQVLRVHRLPDGKLLQRVEVTGALLLCSSFVDGEVVAVIEVPEGADIVRARDGQPLAHLDSGPGTRAMLDPTLAVLATWDLVGVMRLWSFPEGKLLQTHDGDIGVLFSVGPGGRRLYGHLRQVPVHRAPDKMVLWDGETGEIVATYPGVQSGGSISPSGRYLAVAGPDVVHLAQTDSGRILWSTPLDGVGGAIFDHDECRMLASTHDSRATLLDVADGRKIAESWLETIPIGIDVRGWVRGYNTSRWTIWPLSSMSALRPSGAGSGFRVVGTDARGVIVATGGMDGVLRLWEAESGTLLREIRASSEGIADLDLTPSGDWAITGERDGTVRVWDLVTGRAVARMDRPGSLASGAALLPAGRAAVVGFSDGTAGVWDLERDELRPFPGGHPGLWTAEVCPDGTLALTTGREEGTPALIVWDVATGEALFRGPTGIPCYGGRFSADGQLAAVGMHEYGPGLWSADAGWVDQSRLRGSPVMGLDWTADGEIMGLALWDGRIVFTDARSGEDLAVIQQQGRNAMDLLRLGPGRRFAALFSQGDMVVFDLDRVRRTQDSMPRQVGEDLVAGELPGALVTLARSSGLRQDWATAATLFARAREQGVDVSALEEARANTAAGRREAAIEALGRIHDDREIPSGSLAVWRAALRQPESSSPR